MSCPAVTVGLVVGERVADAVAVPEAALWRMARRAQSHALEAGVRGACQAEIRLLPRRGLPGLASALQITIAGDGGVFVSELSTAALEPLIAGPAADLRADMGLPDDVPISYLVLRPREGGDAPVWAKALPAFVAAAPADLPPTSALFPNLDWEGDTRIIINEEVLWQCADGCCDPAVERGGVLLGHVRFARNGMGERLWAQVMAFAPAVGAEAEATRLTFNAEAWRSIQRRRAAIESELGLRQPLQVLGWAHGHPRLAETGGCGSPFFLSPQDVATTAQHFAEPFACALVFDAHAEAGIPLAECLMAFGWDRHGISLVPRSLDVHEDKEVHR